MSWVYRTLVRPVLFLQDSETIHNRTLHALAWASRNELLCDALAAFLDAPHLPVELFGLKFPNPVGLAAGMDKHADAVPAWAALGFGFSELGGVTWHAQPGNPPPRIFRAIADEALVNRMGFNNAGAQALAEKLAQWRALGRWPKHPIGINLGKSKITALDNAAEDYANSFRVLWPHADFFVVNVSSPNTPNLRQLQDKAALDEILAALHEVNAALSRESSARESQISNLKSEIPNPKSTKPTLVKVAPDLSLTALDEILELAGPRQIAGIVATNTTITRPETTDPELRRVYAETGGLSGRPLRARSTEVIRHLYRQTRGTLPIIGVGGIFTAADAWEKITAGASLVQIYTSLVYEGPGVVKRIVAGLAERLARDGFGALHQAVGIVAEP
ncbi:MAG: quinone-dependent dihydroorotate dehydrogenase [Verrucomicrobia bacterium]|nr:quinone-dependent dihydroorotate dehydrogenase [Verrucomicrobiota bacterium]